MLVRSRRASRSGSPTTVLCAYSQRAICLTFLIYVTLTLMVSAPSPSTQRENDPTRTGRRSPPPIQGAVASEDPHAVDSTVSTRLPLGARLPWAA